MRLIYLIFIIALVFSSCRKTAESTFINVKGTLAGAPGCSSWIIQQDNGTSWQPLNLNSFQVTQKDGQPVIFSFIIDNSDGTFCMAGELIKLTFIQNQ